MPDVSDATHSMWLEPAPQSAGIARRAVGKTLTEIGRDDLVDTAGLLVSEIVTNAIVHARSPILVTIRATNAGVRIEVTDASPHLPVQRQYGTSATTGRGVAVVEMLAERFGTEAVTGNGKTVWFELGTASPAPIDAPAEVHHEPDPADVATVTIHLQHLPVALARAWQQHADALLREHLLFCWESEHNDLALLDRQAVASESFSTLTEALAAVVERDDSAEHVDVQMQLSAGAAAGFAELGWVLDQAATMAERGELLAPTTQPELRSLRRWVCEQVLRQAGGREAVPWLGLAADDPVAVARPVDWDVAVVHAATDARIAADDANRIIAASPSALALLGWTAQELVGRRIVSVIPHRFREAHIASFTLHLLNDRTTILGRTVSVPALHHDGSEIPVDLLVEREKAGGGRYVFIATLRPSPAAAGD